MSLHTLDSTSGPTNISNSTSLSRTSSSLVQSQTAQTPTSTLSDHTYLMSCSPTRDRRESIENYKPKIFSTIGQRPACLLCASVTFVGNNEIYAFGGFDQYTDEVYNHVLRLNLETRQWSLVDNYGDIPGVRMGHTATLWQGDKVLIFGGENEHRTYLSDLIIFDIKTAHWHQPDLRGPTPRGRARHSAVIHDDKLFIVGGMSGHNNTPILDDLCYLDLKKWEWSRSWRFTPRFDHTCWVWAGRLWIFGGLTEGMERTSDLWWLDISRTPSLDSYMSNASVERRVVGQRAHRPAQTHALGPSSGTGYTANSSSIQTNQVSNVGSRKPPMAPGSVSSLNFVSGPNIPSQSYGTHFHAFSSGCLLDFATPAVTTPDETSFCALELDSMNWEKLADGRELFNTNYRWSYCALNPEGTHAWLLGCPIDQNGNGMGNPGEFLSDVLTIDLRKFGLLGNNMAPDYRLDLQKLPASDTQATATLTAIGADLSKMFDKSAELGSGADFLVTAECDDSEDELNEGGNSSMALVKHISRVSRPIHVHRLILEARWPHFARMISSQMEEFHSRKLHIPEPYSVVRAFLAYLYTDSIASNSEHGPSLEDVAGMLVISNCYDMPRLRLLCRNRLGKELDIEHAAIIWERAGMANEEWLKKRAARFCLTYWGRVVRTDAFKSLKGSSVVELCQEVDMEGRVLGAEELESVGGLAGAKFNVSAASRDSRARRVDSSSGAIGDDNDDMDDEEGMELS